MKKRHIFIAIIISILAIVLYYEISVRMESNHLKDSIISGEYIILDSTDGSTGDDLSEDKINYLIGVLIEVDLNRKIELLPRGGWGYRLDIEIENEQFRVVFNLPQSITINSAEYYIDIADN